MLFAAMAQYFFGITIFVTSLFLILLVLVQRGRGGGLTGALGGPGGQSAFGTKAGDLFTRITIGVATAWIFLCAAAVFFLKAPALPSTGLGDTAIIAPADASAGTAAQPETTTPAAGGITDDTVTTPAVDPAGVNPADDAEAAASQTDSEPEDSEETPASDSDETPENPASGDNDATTPSDQ